MPSEQDNISKLTKDNIEKIDQNDIKSMLDSVAQTTKLSLKNSKAATKVSLPETKAGTKTQISKSTLASFQKPIIVKAHDLDSISLVSKTID